MIMAVQITCTLAATDYNLMSLILITLGYTVSDATKTPNVQVAIDGTKQFFPNLVKHLEINNGAGILTLKDVNKNVGKVIAANAQEVFDVDEESINLNSIYVNNGTAAAIANLIVDSR